VAALGKPSEVLRENLLREVYDDPNVRTQIVGDQTLIWTELGLR
jgi:hypothetical protein